MVEDTGNILVVDDNSANRNLLARRLEWEGHTVDSVTNGYEALEQMRLHSYDLVLLDIMMPGMNGYEVLEKIKEDDELRHVPVIMITAVDSMDSVVKCIELGAEDYLSKPFNPSLLRARIRASLERKRLHDQEKEFLSELAMMQSLDQELNAALDVQRALSITLNWSLFRSDGTLGAVALVRGGDITDVFTEGVKALSVERFQSLPAVQETIKKKQPIQWINEMAPEGAFIDAGNINQVVVPITRQNEVIGIILLEKKELPLISEKSLAFVTRLSDHAAIALSNAQLHETVQDADRAKSEFVSLVSHELKVPMTSIKGYADLLIGGAAGDINEAQNGFLNTIRSNVNRMATLVSDLSDISRIEAGKLQIEPEAVVLQDAITDALRSTESQIKEREQTLELKMSDDLPMVMADANRLAQILINLLSNAYKYTDNGGKITVSAGKSANKWDEDGAKEVVHVSIADTGVGMSAQDLEMLFTKFFRSDDPNVRQEPGTGLGLNITRLLVELQGGKIWVESELNAGTTCHFTIPTVDGEEEKA